MYNCFEHFTLFILFLPSDPFSGPKMGRIQSQQALGEGRVQLGPHIETKNHIHSHPSLWWNEFRFIEVFCLSYIFLTWSSVLLTPLSPVQSSKTHWTWLPFSRCQPSLTSVQVSSFQEEFIHKHECPLSSLQHSSQRPTLPLLCYLRGLWCTWLPLSLSILQLTDYGNTSLSRFGLTRPAVWDLFRVTLFNQYATRTSSFLMWAQMRAIELDFPQMETITQSLPGQQSSHIIYSIYKACFYWYSLL